MQPASQTTELPETAKKRLGLLAVLAVGVDVAASFLKSKMEKAASVASQVGAAISESKKAVSSAAAAVLGDIQPKPSKIAENRLAKGKARLASLPLFALLAGIFIAQHQAMAIHFWYTLPKYNEKETEQYISLLNTVSLYIPILRVTITIPAPSPEITQYEFSSEIKIPSGTIVSSASEDFYDVNGNLEDTKSTVYLNGGGVITIHQYLSFGVWRSFTYTTRANALGVVDHLKVGKVTDNSPLHFVRRNGKNVGWINQKIVEKWENRIFIPYGAPPKNSGAPRQYRQYSIGYTVYGEGFPDDPTDMGSCKRSYSGTMYGPITAKNYKFCVPSNMSIPSNGYLEYTGFYIDIVRPSDDDDE